MAQQVDVSLEELRTEAERPHAGARLTSAMAALVVGIVYATTVSYLYSHSMAEIDQRSGAPSYSVSWEP